MAKQTQTVSRSAKTGQFVTKHYADTHKATTVTERVKRRRIIGVGITF